MSDRAQYPIYVISKGRFENPLTAKFLLKDKTPFHIVVEEQEYQDYANVIPEEHIVVAPPEVSGQGAIPIRNWVWENSIERGYSHHWILDDNIRAVRRRYKYRRIVCDSGLAFMYVERFINRYENVGLAGMAYTMFVPDGQQHPAFFLNVHVYSCMLIRNDLNCRWRGPYNADVDLCLQTLSLGQCTILVNAFLTEKIRTMTMKGGNTDLLYQGDGRLEMANALKRRWPRIVEVKRRFGRPQHVVNWKKFKMPLIKRPEAETEVEDEFVLKEVKPIKSKSLREGLYGTRG